MSYEERTYRSAVNLERFEYFQSLFLETDIFIGLTRGRLTNEVKKFCLNEIERLRMGIDDFISTHPEFAASLTPQSYDQAVPKSISSLLAAANIAGIGPMGGVAGLFSMVIGQKARREFELDEIIVENGGDIYASVKNPLVISLYAGDSPLSGKLNIRIKSGDWGICTSSGTVGHSLSFGKADALTIISESPVIGDALATSLANKVQGADDIQQVLNYSQQFKEILGIVIIIGDKLGIQGDVELC
ncbi:MAG: UPF0280 family protein [Bacteroidales bacterium]|nr:UPF0280 family protein [Bacteroidales bacterium]